MKFRKFYHEKTVKLDKYKLEDIYDSYISYYEGYAIKKGFASQ